MEEKCPCKVPRKKERDDVIPTGGKKGIDSWSGGMTNFFVLGGKLRREEMGNVLFRSHLSVINALASREGHGRLKITGR